MESRKYQLKKQIVEALKANDNDLYSLLKSQWAHRFGVESLEELQNLDSNQSNLNFINEDNQKNDQSLDYFSDDDKSISLKKDDNQGEIINTTNNEIKTVGNENKESLEIKSYQIVDKEYNENKALNPSSQYKSIPKVEALIPLPPKPKYGYLKKWLLRN